MYRLKNYLKEMSMAQELDMDFDFIRKAEKVTSFNLVEKDFTSDKYQKEIRYLYTKNFFPKFDTNLFTKKIDTEAINKAIGALKRENNTNFNSLYNFKPGGMGPGEVLMFFLIDNAELGGAGSAGVDLVVKGKKYEIKAAQITGDRKYAYGFKLGGTFPTSAIEKKASDLKKQTGQPGSVSEINKEDIAAIRKQFPGEWEKIEKEYAKVSYDNYFKNHEIIFLHNNNSKNKGYVETIQTVKQNQIGLERDTSKSLKPMIKIR